VEGIMAEFLNGENGIVACTRCNGDGVDCDLSQVPELNEECSTMQGVKAGSAFECVQGDTGILHIELPCDWQDPYDWEEMKVAV